MIVDPVTVQVGFECSSHSIFLIVRSAALCMCAIIDRCTARSMISKKDTFFKEVLFPKVEVKTC